MSLRDTKIDRISLAAAISSGVALIGMDSAVEVFFRRMGDHYLIVLAVFFRAND